LDGMEGWNIGLDCMIFKLLSCGEKAMRSVWEKTTQPFSPFYLIWPTNLSACLPACLPVCLPACLPIRAGIERTGSLDGGRAQRPPCAPLGPGICEGYTVYATRRFYGSQHLMRADLSTHLLRYLPACLPLHSHYAVTCFYSKQIKNSKRFLK
jgi:hypothetical protein